MTPSPPPRPSPLPGPSVDGILLVDKPSGPTSHDIVDRVRHALGTRKVGHGGTLDPQATGLLILLVGRATRLSNYFLASDKDYEGTIRLGITTDSQDGQGTILEEKDASAVTEEQLQQAMHQFSGDIFQTPPMVSAVKKDGVPLYKLARRGNTVEREPRLVHIYEFRLLDFTSPRGRFRVRCTKGTYVRTLCADVGDVLGCGAFLEELRRTRCGAYDVRDAIPADDIPRLPRLDLVRCFLPINRLPPRPGA